MQEVEAFLAAAIAEAQSGSTACVACGGNGVLEALVTQQVPFGGGGEHFEVEVPVLKCRDCDFSFTDYRAEKLRKDALYDHLGLLTPDEIKQIRLALDMSRKDFGEAYGLPPASVERWENGKIIQNRSMDTLLRALMNKATAYRLDRRVKPTAVDASLGTLVLGRFPSLESKPGGLEGARRRGASFQLRATG